LTLGDFEAPRDLICRMDSDDVMHPDRIGYQCNKYYNIKEEKVSVIYLSSGILHSNEFNNTKYISKPYILFVGNRHNYKNWKILIDAYSSSDFLKNNYYLVCFGGGNVNNEEKKLLKSKDLTKNVKFVGGSDLKLSSYYLNCELFVYPSLYEGFGMPLLEALNHKKKIVCSEIPVFKEICEDVATYFDPFSKEDIREKLEFSLKSGGKLDVKSIEKVLKRFSWKKCSEHTIEVYNKCI